MLFSTTCSACNTHRLMSGSDVLAMSNGPNGITLTYRCPCSHVSELHTGRKAR